MSEEVVIDTNVFIVSLLDESKLNSEEKSQRPLAVKYIDGLGEGDYLARLPTIAVVEICGVSRWKAGLSAAIATKVTIEQWISQGAIELYEVDVNRTAAAISLVIQHNHSKNRSLSAADATFIGLAKELDINVISFEKYFRKVSSKAVVPS